MPSRDGLSKVGLARATQPRRAPSSEERETLGEQGRNTRRKISTEMHNREHTHLEDEKMRMEEEDDTDCKMFDMNDIVGSQIPTDPLAIQAWPFVDIETETYKQLWKPWKRALIVKVLGKSITFKALEQRVKDIWKLPWGCQMIDPEHGYVLHYLTVARWRPNFRPSTDVIFSTLVWVRFHEIPVEPLNEDILMTMRNKLGKAIKVDQTTINVSRGKYARVCVQIDLKKPMIPYISLLGFDVE
ncbi:hypothetical protein M9H77_20523 [Catharanthus roseus]|uniref:Uncharacterized protein n=1 Tax=Catharanthus roseus TaxID=4058 RepID=A0ACC0ALE3_CATRO|nr:hypothetical protein M9H77_20523 [Catharanthus roseus]